MDVALGSVLLMMGLFSSGAASAASSGAINVSRSVSTTALMLAMQAATA
ncbi:MAG: hypothetical protein RL033_6396, partial [Pseudomonadota bacterium]